MAVQQMRRGIRRAAPVVRHLAVREMLIHLAAGAPAPRSRTNSQQQLPPSCRRAGNAARIRLRGCISA